MQQTTAKHPNQEQMDALIEFAIKYGGNWRGVLLKKWMDGSDANEPKGHLLRQVRNQFGPSWLGKEKP